MPKNKNALIRYRIIDVTIRNKQKPFPSKQELIDACNGLGKVSARTIDKDLYDMKFDEELGYFAPIEFDRKERGYFYIDESYSINKIPLKQEDLYAMEFACSILKPFEEIEAVRRFIESISKIEDFVSMQRTVDNNSWHEIVQTEKAVEYKGSEYLSPLLKCIKERTVIQLHYQRYGEQQVKHYTFHPYVLKEYRNRWYVTGWSENRNAISTFALERIVEVIPVKQRFLPESSFDAVSYFAHSFGISVTNDFQPEVITLKFAAKDAPFIKSMPLHQTQQVLAEDESGIVITLIVIPSYELKAELLSYGDRVKVISPQWLADEHKQTLQQALANYSN
jgi:predicted DNA-binding transcriptional regulator YafY